MGNLPSVSVIVPVYDNWDILLRCLAALDGQSSPIDSFEVLLINNGSEFEGKLPSFRFPIKMVREKKPGSYHARNMGVKLASGDILAFTDADCVPDKRWIEHALARFSSDSSIMRVGGKVALLEHERQRTPVELYEAVFAFPQERYIKETGSAITANMFAYRRLFDEVGLFQGQYKSGSDLEWGRRAQALGYRIVYDPGVLVYHPARRSFRDLAKKVSRVYGARFARALGEKVPFAGLRLVARVIRKGFPDSLIALRSQAPTSWTDRLKVILVIWSSVLVMGYEHIRLVLGGEGRR